LVIGFVNHFNTQHGATNNYNIIAYHILQIITAPSKPFVACYVFTSRFLVTASNSGDSLASGSFLNGSSLPAVPFLHRLPYRTYSVLQLTYLPGWRPFHTSFLVFSTKTDLTTELSPIVFFRLLCRTDFVAPVTTPLYGPSRKHRFQQYLYCCMRIRCHGNVFTEPLPRNGSGILAYLAAVA
jgi:hypothetical protein